MSATPFFITREEGIHQPMDLRKIFTFVLLYHIYFGHFCHNPSPSPSPKSNSKVQFQSPIPKSKPRVQV